MRYNSDLLSQFGNLLQRCTSASINKSGEIPLGLNEGAEPNVVLANAIDTLAGEKLSTVFRSFSQCSPSPPLFQSERFDAAVEARDFGGALALAADLVGDLNKYFTESKPWTLTKKPEDAAKLRTVLFYTYECLRVVAILLQPVMPKITAEILDRLAVEPDQRAFGNARLGRRWLSGEGGQGREAPKVVISGSVIFPKLPTN